MIDLYVSTCRPGHVPTMPELLAEVANFLVNADIHSVALEPLRGSWCGECENSARVRLAPDDSYDPVGEALFVARAMTKRFQQECVMIVSDEPIGSSSDRCRRVCVAESEMRTLGIDCYSRAWAGNAATAFVPDPNGDRYILKVS